MEKCKIILKSGYIIHLQLPILMEAEKYTDSSSFVDAIKSYTYDVLIISESKSIYLDPSEIAVIIFE